MTCPWSNFELASVSFCEERLCAWIVSPADTISNLGYFVVAVVLFKLIRRDERRDLKPLAIAALCVAIGSTLFHATGTFWAEVLDVGSMFLFTGFIIARNLYRLGLSHEKWIRWGIVGGSVLTLLLNHPIGINLFIGHVVVWLGTELLLSNKTPKESYKPLIALAMIFAAAYSFWWVDQLKLVCDPTNHFATWHSAWHLTNAFAFYYAYRFYRQIPHPETGRLF